MSRTWRTAPGAGEAGHVSGALGAMNLGPLRVSVARPQEEEKELGTGLDVLKSGQIQNKAHKQRHV